MKMKKTIHTNLSNESMNILKHYSSKNTQNNKKIGKGYGAIIDQALNYFHHSYVQFDVETIEILKKIQSRTGLTRNTIIKTALIMYFFHEEQ